jgi:hypothetical protein
MVDSVSKEIDHNMEIMGEENVEDEELEEK